MDSSAIPLGDTQDTTKEQGRQCLKNRGLREEHVQCQFYTLMPFAETPQLLKSLLTPLACSVYLPATAMDIADSVRDADNIRLNKIAC